VCSQLLHRNVNAAKQSERFSSSVADCGFDWAIQLRDLRLDYVRLGQWVFIPQPDLDIPLDRAEKNATLVSGAHSHSAEWLYRTRDPGRRTYARGRVSRSDFRTIELAVWHRVVFGAADD
jgi:hypothetical protein